MSGQVPCPECGGALRVMVDITVHPRLLRRADGRPYMGNAPRETMAVIRELIDERTLCGDDDLACDSCSWIGTPVTLAAAKARAS